MTCRKPPGLETWFSPLSPTVQNQQKWPSEQEPSMRFGSMTKPYLAYQGFFLKKLKIRNAEMLTGTTNKDDGRSMMSSAQFHLWPSTSTEIPLVSSEMHRCFFRGKSPCARKITCCRFKLPSGKQTQLWKSNIGYFQGRKLNNLNYQREYPMKTHERSH